MKICKEIGCNNNVFGGGYCKYHAYKRYMRGGDLYKPKPRKKRKAIPKKSKSRNAREPYYKEIKDELRAEMMAEGTYNCFFCGKPMGDEKGFHHLKGRVGKNYTDRKYLQPAHNKCHVEDYHPSTWEQLNSFAWYDGFLLRLKSIDEKLWRAELRKKDKSLPLNPKIEFDDDELF